jgi:hypothetical protein
MRTLLACAGWIGLLPALSLADGARIAQQARPGEIIVTRTVAARPADRPATAPGMALMVSASPNPQLVNTLTGGNGPGETTDAEIANLNAGPGAAVSPIQTGVQRSVNVALGVNAGGNSAGAISGNGVSNTVSAPAGGGAIADSTRNIGQQVTGALAQIPLLGAGH